MSEAAQRLKTERLFVDQEEGEHKATILKRKEKVGDTGGGGLCLAT